MKAVAGPILVRTLNSMLNTPWYNIRLDRIGSGKLAARGHDVLRILSERGIVVAADGRLQRALKLMDRINEDAQAFHGLSDADAERLLEATRTVFESFLVTWAMIERPRKTLPFRKEKLCAFLEGADLPREESNSSARNIQFELVVGAHLILGGADIMPEEPDYSLLYHGTYVGVAVKRLTSTNANTLRTRLREAVAQIEVNKGVGFAAVNLDNWITDLGADLPDDVGRSFQAQLANAYREVAKLAGRKNTLLGVLIFGTWLRWFYQEGLRRLDWRNPFQFVGFGDSTPEQDRFNEYFAGLRARWESSMVELGALITAAA